MTPDAAASPGLRIGELAAIAGVTARTIRHYHATGLLPEPPRDHSGYRRYGRRDVVALIRVRRLRDLGMPIGQIAETIASGGAARDADLPAALRALADDLDRQMGVLLDMRSRLLSFAASGASEEPATAWATELRRHGLLADDASLPDAERDAVALVDALHPTGIEGLIAQSRPVLADPAVTKRVGTLLRRARDLPDDADDATIDALVAELLAAFPRPAHHPPPVDLAAMDNLVGDRLSIGQRRLMRRFRRAVEIRER